MEAGGIHADPRFTIYRFMDNKKVHDPYIKNSKYPRSLFNKIPKLDIDI